MTTTLLDYLKEPNFGKQTLLDILINGNQYPVALRNENPDFSRPTQQITNLRPSQYELRLQYGMRSIESGIITDLSLYGNDATIEGREVTNEDFTTPGVLGVAITLSGASAARVAAGDASVAVISGVTVTTSPFSITYTEDVDYTIDIIAGTITPIVTGNMAINTDYKIDYTYYTYGRGQNQYALHLDNTKKVTCIHSDSVNLTDAMTLIAVSDNISSGDLIKKDDSYHIKIAVTHVDDYVPTAVVPDNTPTPISDEGIYNVIVESVGGGILYVDGTDYAINNTEGTITILDFGTITGSYQITYDSYVCTAGIYIPDDVSSPTLHELIANIRPGFTHIALTYSSSSKFKQLKLYVDSKLVAWENLSDALSNDIIESANSINISTGMEVIIDELAIYGEELSHKEIVSDYYYRDDKLSGSIVRGGGGSTPSTFFEGLTNVTVVNDATYTLLSTDYLLDVKRTATGTCAITIPASECYYGRTFRIKDSGGNAFTNNITVTATGYNFEGLGSILIRDNYRGLEFYFNGTEFMIMSMK